MLPIALGGEAFYPLLIISLEQVKKGGHDFLLLLKCVFCQLSKVYELVFSASVLPEGSMFFANQVIGFQVSHESLVDHVLQGLAKTAEQAEESVAGLFKIFFYRSFCLEEVPD